MRTVIRVGGKTSEILTGLVAGMRAKSPDGGVVTWDGERVPPEPGSKACEVYEPAGRGAGKEKDGHPQCAGCGHPRSLHKPCRRFFSMKELPEGLDGDPHSCLDCGLPEHQHKGRK
jgi:hypothetical protein